MIKIDAIFESKEIVEYLIKRNILEQYKKAREMMLQGHFQKFDFKLRKPKLAQVYQFRINQKYRAFGIFREENEKIFFLVTKISDHQDF